MLVLTRKLQQQIKIGDQITVTILRVKGSTVRIGIDAPREVRVVRGELPPKIDGSQPAEATVIEARVSVAEHSDEGASDEASTPSANEASPLVNPALPPRHVLSRLGKAPLRQIMANAALAK